MLATNKVGGALIHNQFNKKLAPNAELGSNLEIDETHGVVRYSESLNIIDPSEETLQELCEKFDIEYDCGLLFRKPSNKLGAILKDGKILLILCIGETQIQDLLRQGLTLKQSIAKVKRDFQEIKRLMLLEFSPENAFSR